MAQKLKGFVDIDSVLPLQLVAPVIAAVHYKAHGGSSFDRGGRDGKSCSHGKQVQGLASGHHGI
jgi:hypothetical protein